MEAHDASDDKQTSTVVTEWTADTGKAPLGDSGPVDARPSDGRPTDGRPSDAALIERSRQEPDCFAGIFDRHADEILRYAHARLGPDLAEDITAETFLAAFRRRDHYDLTWADARPWLYGIAIRLIGKHRRAEGRYRRMLQTVPADRRTGRDGGCWIRAAGGGRPGSHRPAGTPARTPGRTPGPAGDRRSHRGRRGGRRRCDHEPAPGWRRPPRPAGSFPAGPGPGPGRLGGPAPTQRGLHGYPA